MWAALRTDLTEFVSTVREDTGTVLSAIDDKLTDAEHGGERHGGNAPTVILGEDGEVTYTDQPSGFDVTGIVSSAADEVARLRSLEETYTSPLLSEEGVKSDEDEEETSDAPVVDESEILQIKEFIADFNVASKTGDIAAVLETYPHTVKVHFEQLVPTSVTYEQFWQRYYYRCDENRVQQVWDENAEKARIARQKAISGGIESVKSIFGGAAKALGVGGEEEPSTGSSTYEKYQADIKKETAAAGNGLGASLFGAGGRPPFVMNTAVSDVDDGMDDMEEEEEDEEEEEELGWSDDEDEEEEESENEVEEEEVEEDVEEGSEAEEQIDFTSADGDALEVLRKQVAQAEEERDQLHSTVEMQAKEIADLRQVAETSSSKGGAIPATLNEVEKMKMQLFEKNSEIAALKASLEDSHEESAANKESCAKLTALENELRQMKTNVHSKDEEVIGLKELIAKAKADTSNITKKWGADKKALEDANSLIVKLQSELEEARNTLAQNTREIVVLKDSVEHSKANSSAGALAAGKEAAEAREKMQSLRSELDTWKQKAQEAETNAATLKVDLAKVQKEKEEQDLNFSKMLEEEANKVHVNHAVTTPPPADGDEESNPSSSLSSAVKVPASPKVSPLAVPNEDEDNDDDDDDWGDSWGDEDD